MKVHTQIYTAVLCLALSMTASPGLAQPDEPRFIIRHEGVNDRYADLVGEYAEAAYGKLTVLLGHGLKYPVTIEIAPTEERFKELTEGRLPDWSAAVAIGYDTIVLSPLEGHKQDLNHVLTHELAHLIINDAAGGRMVPRWFHEGVAEILGGNLGIQGKLYLMVRSAQNDLLTFDDIEDVFASGQVDATLAYDQSMLAVQQLTADYGEDTVRNILARMTQGDSFDDAFAATTGASVAGFERIYLGAIRHRYGYLSLIASFLNIWTIILGVAVLAFVLQRIRTRRIMRRWEEEEDSDSRILHFPDDFE